MLNDNICPGRAVASPVIGLTKALQDSKQAEMLSPRQLTGLYRCVPTVAGVIGLTVKIKNTPPNEPSPSRGPTDRTNDKRYRGVFAAGRCVKELYACYQTDQRQMNVRRSTLASTVTYRLGR